MVILQLWMVFIKPTYFYPYLLLTFLPYQLLPGPLFLLFAMHFLGWEGKIQKRKFWLFVPFWIFMVVYLWMKLDVVINEIPYKVAYHKYFSVFKVEEVITLSYAFILALWCYGIVRSFERQNRDKKYDQVVSHTGWIKRVLGMGLGLCILWLISFLFDAVSIYNWGNYAYLPTWFGFSTLIIYIGYTGFRQTDILKERHALNQFSKSKTFDPEFAPMEKEDPSTLKHFQKIEVLMRVEKKYLNPHLDLPLLAEEISISPNYLSKVINSHAHMHFNDYLNSYRVAHAKEMLETEAFRQYDMLSIALEAGFNSKSAFYAAFKKLTGQTPGSYRSQCEKHHES
ncbi:helix-turn-helix domain-containing protein [Aureisphaera galaxeae]|uniref:helix-turn-helix domain-containing protein n=1 Tax=Aureisphaera galaxeae TaxID=1538023 RepID=UPI002350D937|nr:helix-turn-helix domain-containing protein [Aureisphaera galaxeae]